MTKTLKEFNKYKSVMEFKGYKVFTRNFEITFKHSNISSAPVVKFIQVGDDKFKEVR
jgi:hypothetical protein